MTPPDPTLLRLLESDRELAALPRLVWCNPAWAQHPESRPLPWQLLGEDQHLASLPPQQLPEDLLSLIAPAPRRVLDVGCFRGAAGRWLQERFPGCRVMGIEPMAAAAREAAEGYEQVIAAPLEAVDFAAAGWSEGSFDVIVAGDVLEHLVNPWQALQRLQPLLAPGGALYASVPNARNLVVLRELAGGDWPYAEAGILDVSHLRFFTLRSLQRMFQQTGWQVQRVAASYDPRLTPYWRGRELEQITTIEAGPLQLRHQTRQEVQELLTLRFLVVARPRS